MARTTPRRRRPHRTANEDPSTNGNGGNVRLPDSRKALGEIPQTGVTPMDNGFSAVTPQRVYTYKLTRFSPIRRLEPEQLASQIDQFYAGTLRWFALTMDAVERRDDVLSSVVPKRRAAVSRRRIEVVPDDDADPEESSKHAAVLRYFYKNARVTHAVDVDQAGGQEMLIAGILDAQLKRYSVHEVIWRPTTDEIELTAPDDDGDEHGRLVGTTTGLTATFNFVPLWFFENRTGKMRFLKSDFDYAGVDMEAGAWMVAVGQGVMEAAVVAYMFKKLGMQDWLIYCQKHGMPGVQGKTKFSKGSDGWNNMVEAVAMIAADFSCVTNLDDIIEKIDMTADGALPYPPLVERMDRAMSALMRGADLSTMSGHSQQGGEGGQGASLQGEESDIMEADDASFVSGVLNRKIDELVIQYHFGEGVRPLARAVVMVPTRQDVQADVAVDTFLLSSGVELGQRETLERYGRSPRKPDDKPLTAPAPNGAADPNADPQAEAERFQANEAQRDLLVRSDDVFRGATYQALKPLADRLAGVLELPDQAYEFGLKRLVEDLPAILREINADPANAKALQDAMSAGWLNGVVADAVQAHGAMMKNDKDALGHGSEKHGDRATTEPDPNFMGGRFVGRGSPKAAYAKAKKDYFDQQKRLADKFLGHASEERKKIGRERMAEAERVAKLSDVEFHDYVGDEWLNDDKLRTTQ
jgi:hypothetical protein